MKLFNVYRKGMLENEIFGALLHKITISFFQKSFAFSYIKKSRINESYKVEHCNKI